MQSPAAQTSSSQPAPQSNGAPAGGPSDFIGALISLISRADIRYQGFLASIDPVQATIALEKVRSWGTEGRLAPQGRAHEEIPPNDNIYDYIVFRAADVKDLQIDDPNPIRPGIAPAPQALQDPAILGSSGSAASPVQRFGGPPGPPGGYAYGPGPGFGPPGGFYRPPPPPPQQPQQQPPPQQQQQQQQLQHQAPPSQPSVTSPITSKAASQSEKKQAEKGEPTSAKANGSAAAAASTPATPSATDALATDVANLLVSKKPLSPSKSASPSAADNPKSPQKSHHLPAVPRAAAAAAQQHQPNQQPRQNRGVPGSGGRTGPNSASRRQGGGGMYDVPLPLGPAPVPAQDYDFESANKKFEDERKQQQSAKSPNPSKAATNGTEESETLDFIPPPEDTVNAGPKSFYDPKTTGFFDNISSEVKERHERPIGGNRGGRNSGQRNEDGGPRRGGAGGGNRGRNQRMVEERRNLQTFGDTGNANPRNSGTGPGRGGFNGRGRGRRGGYRGGPSHIEA